MWNALIFYFSFVLANTIGGNVYVVADALSTEALDAQDKASISYQDGSNADLEYTVSSSGAWVKTMVDNSSTSVGWFNSIALDDQGKAHISYYDSHNETLKYATNTSGKWVNDHGG